ncbi:MAG: ribose-phosphate pyrophosphokinase [Parcubacteria group bacterium Gr01-1014_8]|nr:MAG: ribose-phosphate pyrophosphokinase [Parcubacteria group bacterium Gr01-1014_8]
MNHDRPIKIFTGVAGQAMGEAVCKRLGIKLGEAQVARFNDGEVRVQILENVRDTDVFIINPTNPPAENILEMVLLAEAAHDSSAGRITLVPTYLGYNRQDRKDRPRVATSARVIIDFLAHSGADRALLFDVHSEPTAGFFHPLMVDHLYSSSVTVPYLKNILSESSIVASPDKNAVRAEAYARRLGHEDFVVFSKSRSAPGQVKRESIKIIGSVEGKDVLFVDDIIDSGGTMIADAEAAKEAGAKKIFCYATHAVFASNPRKVIEAFDDSAVDEVIVTDSIPHDPELLKSKRVKITVLPLAELVAQGIERLHEGKSLSELIR